MSLLLTQLGGAVDITGAAASVQRAQTGAATGAITVSGSSAGTEKAQSSASAGIITVSGSAAGTEKAQTGASTGTITVSGSAADSQTAQTSTATGSSGAVEPPRAVGGKASKVKFSPWINWTPLAWVQWERPDIFGWGWSTISPAKSSASGSVGRKGKAASRAPRAASRANGMVELPRPIAPKPAAAKGNATSVAKRASSFALGSVQLQMIGRAAGMGRFSSFATGTINQHGKATSRALPAASAASGRIGYDTEEIAAVLLFTA